MARPQWLCVIFLLCMLSCCPLAFASPSPSDINSFAQTLQGYVYQANDTGFVNLTRIDNGRIQLTPLLVVVPTSIADIQKSISFAQNWSIPFSVKNGGHSAAGYCLNEGGLVLSLNKWNQSWLNVTNKTLKLQSGAIWLGVYKLLDGTGLYVIGGACATVGISGFLQGGGMSWLSRSYGLGIDSVLEFGVVTSSGDYVIASNSSNSDLYWALRGGGGGNFGVVTDVTLALHPQPSATLFYADLCWPMGPTQRAVTSFVMRWALNGVPNQMAVYSNYGRSNGTLRYCVQMMYNGLYEKGLEIALPLLALNPLQSTFLNTSLYDDELILGMSTEVADRKAYIKSGYFPSSGIEEAAIDIVEAAILSSPSNDSMFLFIHLGGKMAEVPASATAYAHRSASFDWEVKSIWTEDAEMSANIEWAQNLGAALAPYNIGAYVNYIDPWLGNWQEQYYGNNYPQLLNIKQKWDPNDFFSFNQSIGAAIVMR